MSRKKTPPSFCVLYKELSISPTVLTHKSTTLQKTFWKQPLPIRPLVQNPSLRRRNLPAILFPKTIKAGFIINILKFGTRIPHMCIFFTTAKAKTGFLIGTCFLFGLKYIVESNLMRFETEPLNTRFFVSVLMCLKNC